MKEKKCSRFASQNTKKNTKKIVDNKTFFVRQEA